MRRGGGEIRPLRSRSNELDHGFLDVKTLPCSAESSFVTKYFGGMFVPNRILMATAEPVARCKPED
jgi:hypothetical protein